MKDQLQQEKSNIEAQIKEQEATIDGIKNNIYWQKKRIRLIDAQLSSLEEKTNGVPQEANN